MTGEPVRPGYGRSSLADLLPGLASHLDVPGHQDDVLGLPSSRRYVVVLVDGLGRQLLHRSAAEAPYLAGLLDRDGAVVGNRITAGVPSTTATSLTSLGTGLAPGRHGMVGYSYRLPGTSTVLNTLAWDADVDPVALQPQPTVFERALAAGVRVSSVGPTRFEHSGLTRAALRGPVFLGVREDWPAERRIAAVVDAASTGSRTLVYAYERRLDHAGHVHGCGSTTWRSELRRVDDYCARLRASLPSDVVLIVTGDHGMVDVPPEHRVIVEDTPQLRIGVAGLAGEGRFRQLYLDQAVTGSEAERQSERLAGRWAEVLGDRAWIRTRSAAIDDGWFGAVAESVVERYGHVLVAMRDDWAVMTRAFPRELDLVGMHGSLTAAEMDVPLLCD